MFYICLAKQVSLGSLSLADVDLLCYKVGKATSEHSKEMTSDGLSLWDLFGASHTSVWVRNGQNKLAPSRLA